MAPDTTFFIPPADIDAMGGADVTDAMNRFLDTVPDGGIVRFPPSAQYRIEGTILLENRNGLTIQGNGAKLFATTDGSIARPPSSIAHQWPRSRQQMLFVGGTGIVIRDLTIQGANPNAGSAKGAYVESLEGQHALKFSGVRGVILDRITVTDTYGDFLYLGGDGDEFTSEVHVTEAHFERSGRQGIAITGAEDVLVERSYIGEVGRTIIDLEPNTANGRATSIVFRENTFGPCRHLLLAAGGRGPNVGPVEFVNNALVGMQIKVYVQASDGARRGPVRFIGNQSDTPLGTPLPAMRFTRVDGIEVRGNVQPMVLRRDMTAVEAVESCDVEIADNVFVDAARISTVEPFNCPRS